MTSTERKGKTRTKLSDMFKRSSTKNNKPPPKGRKNRYRSSSVPENEFEDININLKYIKPQTTAGYASHTKAFIFNDEDNIQTTNTPHKLASPRSKHQTQSSLNLVQNPLSLGSIINPSEKHPNPLSNVALIDLETIMQEIDSQKVRINIRNDDSYSSISSFGGIDNSDDFCPPGYSATASPNSIHDKRKHNKYKRRKSNRKDIWRRMMQSVVDGVGNAMQFINEDDDDEEVIIDDIKYDKYESVTQNNIFRHNGYKIQHRLSSHEVLHSRYTSKCCRRKNRPRSKSDPSLLPHTRRFHRKLETEYRPGTMNIFMMRSQKKQKADFPTRSHRDSVHFKYLFDDSDFDDDSHEWSEDELEILLNTYDFDTRQKMEHKNNSNPPKSNGSNGSHQLATANKAKLNLNKLQLNKFKSLPGHIGKGFDRLKTVSSAHILNDKLKPYGGHVEASTSMIQDTFGANIPHIVEYRVKKRNKLGRDKHRVAVLDIPLQVLRIKDKNGKTHKEHIVSSISDHVIVGSVSEARQIIIKFYDNRDYFLTFDSNRHCIEFRDLIEKLRKFNLKMITQRPNKKLTMSPGMTIGNVHGDIGRDARSHSMNMMQLATGPGAGHGAVDSGGNYGFYDDDDEASMSLQSHPNGGQLRIGRGGRERFDTEMFEGLVDDGNVYTGMATSNVVYRIVKINKWGTKKERTMIVHKADRTVRLFDDKRRCHSEYPLKIMATLEIIDSLNVEVVFLINQKPTRFVFRSHIDLWDFVEQIRTIAPNEIMVSDRRMGNDKNATIHINAKATNKLKSSTNDLFVENESNGSKVELGFDADLDVNPNVLRYSVLRLIRAKRNQDIIWRQHRRVLYLDLEKRIVRMLTLGMHIKDYKFRDILLLEKSYINVNQLHVTCKHKNKIKEYWYEFVSPQARAEFVGRLLRALPGTKQSPRKSVSRNPLSPDIDQNHTTKPPRPQIDIYAELMSQKASNNPNISTQGTISPRSNSRPKNAKKKKRRKRLSSETLRGLIAGGNDAFKSKSVSPVPTPPLHEKNIINLDISDALNEGELNGLKSDDDNGYLSMGIDENKNKYFTEDALSIIVGSWNVSESEINFANLNMWIPPSKMEPHDIYVIGLQECSSSLRKQWIAGILRHIDSERGEYVLLNKTWLMGIGIIIIVHRCHVTKISHLHSQVVPTGKGNIIGNKGATAISFQFQETSFIFINAHLAARAERYEKRAKNFNRIIKNLELGRPGLDVLHQFTHTFFLGDLNYRIELDFYSTVEMVKKKKWSELIKADQLREQMEKKDGVFYGFKEGEIHFCPTYRWEKNKNTISNKRDQPPSYCDRILYKSLPQTYDLWQECYLSSHRCFGSDHRPVWSLFKFKPKMPYFTLSAHELNDNQLQNNNQNESYTNISISLVELQASFKVIINKKLQIHLEDEIDIILHYNYAPKAIRICGGKFDKTSAFWRWPIETLDSLRIKPFIPDPTFIARTHLFISFINVSKGNLCFGYCIISLFNAFPKSLIDTNKLIKQYDKTQKQMNLMPSQHNHNDTKNSFHTQSGNKQFNVPVLLYGNCVGSLSGFVYADGSIVDKHRKITNLDLLSQYENQNQQKSQKNSIFQKASARFNIKK